MTHDHRTARGNVLVRSVVVVAAASMLAAGGWARLDPASFAAFTRWPNHVHFLHDAGVFQIAIGAMLLGALWQRDVLVLVLAGFVLAGGLHAVNHAVDTGGGNPADPWLLGGLTLAAAAALAVRLRALRLARDARREAAR